MHFTAEITNPLYLYFFNRWRTLLSVDDLVEQVVMALDKGKHLDNTYIIFSSDNGFHLGKFDQILFSVLGSELMA